MNKKLLQTTITKLFRTSQKWVLFLQVVLSSKQETYVIDHIDSF